MIKKKVVFTLPHEWSRQNKMLFTLSPPSGIDGKRLILNIYPPLGVDVQKKFYLSILRSSREKYNFIYPPQKTACEKNMYWLFHTCPS